MDDEVAMWDHVYKFCADQVAVSSREDLDAGLGGTLFDGSVALSRFLETLAGEQGAEAFRGKRVVELGAGCGLPGLLLGHLHARVVLTDIAQAVPLLEENIENNRFTPAQVSACALDWSRPSDLDAFCLLHGQEFDYILAADTIYDAELVLPFVGILRRLAGPRTQVLFAAPRPRVQLATDLFFAQMHGGDFAVEKVAARRYMPELKPGAPAGKEARPPNEGLFVITLAAM
jgi:predicted nicotinamide N-methyase